MLDYDKAHALYQQGRSLMEKGDLAKAIQAFEDSGALAPHFKTFEL